MTKKLKNTNFLFVVSLISVALLHLFFIFAVPFSDDETYYVTVPLRLLNGDSLVQHEWHLTQFSTLFSYLPVYIWTAIKGSAEGIFIFLRCTYLLIHTIISVVIYRFFKKYGKWAIMASMIFFIQSPYRILAISYHSMFVIFLLLLTFCILSIYEKESTRLYVCAGICFGCCCVCNPLFCFAFPLYLVACIVWTRRQAIMSFLVRRKTAKSLQQGKKLTKKQKREQKQQVLESFPNIENYNRFFTSKAVLLILCGLVIAAAVAATFFFSTGGTINSIQDNIDNLLDSSEYDAASETIFSKLLETFKYFTMANLGMPWIVPLLFVVLAFDKNRKQNSHRLAYLLVSIVWTIIFMIGVMKSTLIDVYAISLPFAVISAICYILTENKNKALFHCMCMPSLIALVFQYLAANTHLAVIGIVLAVNNVAGVFFAKDLWEEMRYVPQEQSETTEKRKGNAFRNIIIVGFCLQMLFHGIFYQYGQIYGKDAPKATNGPFLGLYMPELRYNKYNNAIKDLDIIKEISNEDDAVLMVTYNNWMYLYLDRPIATYTTWYQGTIHPKLLIRYYKENPEKIPKYIYYEASDPKNARVDIINEMFQVSREELSNGVLLTVEYCKF